MTARLSELLGVQRAQALGERETFPARAMLPVTAYGLSMLWAWFLLTFLSPVLLSAGSVSPTHAAMARGLLLAGASFAFFVISRRPVYFDRDRTPRALILAFLLTLPSNVLALVAESATVAPLLLLPGFFLSGCAFAITLIQWSQVLVNSWQHVVGTYVAASAIIGAVHYLFAASLVGRYAVVVALLLPLWSLTVLVFVRYRTHPMPFREPDQPVKHILPPGMSLVIVLYGILFGVATHMLLRTPLHDESMLPLAIAFALGGFSYLAASVILDRYIPFGIILKTLLPVLVLVFFLMPFLSLTGQWVCALVLLAMLSFFDIANLSTVVARANEQGLSASVVIAYGRIFLPLGLFMGWSAAQAFLPDDITYPHLSAFILLGGVVVLAVTAAVIPLMVHSVEETEEISEPNRSSGGWFVRRCEKAAEIYGLSEREQDVLRLLAKGRHANYIGNALHISPHTAKTHIYHIYKKMSVNSLEELMDTIEHMEC